MIYLFILIPVAVFLVGAGLFMRFFLWAELDRKPEEDGL